ncbi:hypothetical protein I4U23_011468 [Adineta vaga]|nr:hypothetical protein I4U23_011468 [Adineta vaga]
MFFYLFISFLLIEIHSERLFSINCSSTNKICQLFQIDIDQLNNRALSNQINQWDQINIQQNFGSIASFEKNQKLFIFITNNCDNQGYLINITDLSYSPSIISMKTSCSQPIHSFNHQYLLILGTKSNNQGGSSPFSLYLLDPITGQSAREIVNFGEQFTNIYQVLHPQTGFSYINFNQVEPTYEIILYNLINTTRHILVINIKTGEWIMKQIENNLLRNVVYSKELKLPISDCSLGGICLLNEKDQWKLFLSIPNFINFIDWTFSNEKQIMYFIQKENIILIDLSNKSSFNYQILPLIQQTGDIQHIDKTIVF